MPIPTINLIPAAYYLRKKVKVAWALAGLFLVAEAVGLVALGIWQGGETKRLTEEQQTLQAEVDAIAAINADADSKATAAQDVIQKARFVSSAVDPVKGTNAAWADLFKNLAMYVYPGAVVTNITPGEAGTTTVNMHLRVAIPNAKNRIATMHKVWWNLRRCPIADKVGISSYGTMGGDTSGSSSIGPGGPPMPGMPTSGGPPMPGAPTPGRYIGSGSSLAQPATTAAGEYNQMLGAPQGAMPGMPGSPDLTGGLTTQVIGPKEPPMYDVDVTIQLLKAIEVASAPGVAAAPAQQQ